MENAKCDRNLGGAGCRENESQLEGPHETKTRSEMGAVDRSQPAESRRNTRGAGGGDYRPDAHVSVLAGASEHKGESAAGPFAVVQVADKECLTAESAVGALLAIEAVTRPSDADMEAVARQHCGTTYTNRHLSDEPAFAFSYAQTLAFARAVLAHWGSPHVAEPADAFKLGPAKVTEEMHVAAVKVLHRADGLDGLPQRMLDAMLAAAPNPPTDASQWSKPDREPSEDGFPYG